MIAPPTQKPLSIRRFFSGKGVLITGSTGFLAKAVVEKILHDLPEVRKVYLLIRPRAKADGSRIDPRERLREEILRNSAFSRLRARHGENFAAFCKERIECVSGDLTHERLGLDSDAFKRLAGEVQVVMGSAATVVFDERLDHALEINTLSTIRLLEFCQAAGASYVHISTTYVSGMRKGLIPEELLEPLAAIEAQLPTGSPRPAKFELFKEIEQLKTLSKIVTSDCEMQAHKHGWTPESEEASSALRRALVSAGMRRARSLGWHDTYTYTKWLGEQLIRTKHGAVPVAIVRTSIIESSLREPEPGWIDGLRMADPLILGFGKGRLSDFPANREVVLDIIPADLVVNAILASAAATGGQSGALELLHVASSHDNPLLIEQLYQAVRDYFQKYPMLDKEGRPVRVPHWKFPTVERFKRRMNYGYLKPMQALSVLVDGPVTLPGTRRLRSRLRSLNLAMEQLLYLVDLYGPYTNLDCRYETRKLHVLLERLLPEERAIFDFDPRKIPWRHYLQDVHIPGLKRNILRMGAPPRAGAGEDTFLKDEAAKVEARVAPALHGVPQTMVELAARGADRFGGKSFLEVQRGTATLRYSFGEFFEQSARWARKLRAKLGIQHGDRVVLWSENAPEWCVAYLAIVRAGAIAVPLDRQLSPAEVARLAGVVDAKALIVSPSARALAGSVWASGSGAPPLLDVRADLEPHGGFAWPFPEAVLDSKALSQPTPEATASILFTSGTTGATRGVMLSQVNFTSNALAVAEVLVPLPSDQFVSVLPLHHALEFTGGFLAPLFGGATVHHVESLKDVSATMKRTGCTVVIGVPRLYQLFADGIRDKLAEAGVPKKMLVSLLSGVAATAEAFGSEKARKRLFTKVHEAFGGKLRVLVSGGAPLSPELFHFLKRFAFPLVEGYGLTETAPILTVNPIAAPKVGSVGLPLPGAELRIGNPDAGGIGEILVRGPMVMQGYWRDPESSASALEAGWFKTGDLGRLDQEGYVHLTGRVKDVVVTAAGKKVYPDGIELLFQALPKTREFSAVGLSARQGQGEELALVVVPEQDSDAVRAEIRAAVEKINHGLPSHQQVARVEFQDTELPRTSTLKVQRAKLRERFTTASRAGRSGAVQTVASTVGAATASGTNVEKEVLRAVAEITGVAPHKIGLDQQLQLDLGLDSFGRVDLIGKLELRLNLAIPDDLTTKLRTVRDVAEVAAKAAASGGSAPNRSAHALTERLWTSAAQNETTRVLAPSLGKSVLQGVMRTTERIFFNAYLSIDAYGIEYLPPTGPFILAANHSSHLDTAAVRAVLGQRSAQLHVMGAKDYFFDTRLKSWFFSTVFNVLPFEREENTLEGLALCRTALEQGRALLIYPEGTRTRTGKLQAFKPGIGVLALELDTPILPVHLRGTFEALPKGRRVPRPTQVSVRFGPAVDVSALRVRKLDLENAPPKGGTERKDRKDRKRKLGQMDLYRAAADQIRTAVERLGGTGS